MLRVFWCHRQLDLENFAQLTAPLMFLWKNVAYQVEVGKTSCICCFSDCFFLIFQPHDGLLNCHCHHFGPRLDKYQQQKQMRMQHNQIQDIFSADLCTNERQKNTQLRLEMLNESVYFGSLKKTWLQNIPTLFQCSLDENILVVKSALEAQLIDYYSLWLCTGPK